MRQIIIDLISVWETLVSKLTNLGVIPMIGVISKDPVDGECVQGYELTKDAKKCMRAQEVDCNSPLCTGEKWRGGSIFCDEYAQVTGSRIAIGGCYDRNDNPEEYCVNYQDGK